MSHTPGLRGADAIGHYLHKRRLMSQPNCEKCGIRFHRRGGSDASIVFCPLHQAAPELLKAVKRMEQYLRAEQREDTLAEPNVLKRMLEETIATTEGRG